MSGFVHLIYLAISVYAWLIVARAVMIWLRHADEPRDRGPLCTG